MNHEIGLHYDIGAYQSYNKPIEESLLFEIKILEQMLDIKIKSITMHSPSTFNSDPFEEFPGYINAYNILKIYNIFYVSDSSRGWRYQYISKFLKEIPPKVQFCFHPLLWVWETSAKNHEEHLDRLFKYLIEEKEKQKEQWKIFWNTVPHLKKYENELKLKKHLLDFN